MRLYNTLSRQIEEFAPMNGNEVLLYVCGITPYSESHLGHAMSYVIFDTLRRYLEFKGFDVRHVQNYTDIDDKLIARSEREGVPMGQIAERYINEFERDIAELNILPAHVYPRATQEVSEIVEMIQGLVANGYAYAGPGREGGSHDVYYRVERKDDYGKLSKRTLDSMLSGARIEPLEGKENPMDFTLWKGAKPGEPAWDSPWGPGRPGWHIECSAMSLHHLGKQIDIHGGGLDLVFPHHENEIAQTEAFTDVVPFARFWVHNGFLQMGEEKMSKSLGNFITMRQAIDFAGPDGLRIFILGSSYRSPLTYSEEAMTAGKVAAERLRNAANLEDTGAGEHLDATAFHDRFVAAMEEDLNTAQALSVLFELSREINRARDAGRAIGGAQSVLRELAALLGLRLMGAGNESIAAAPFIELLIELRKELREAKQYQLADRIRNGLGELGVTLEDAAGKTTWKTN
ncbi:MAG: cysteine--tRNA ligase [Dehalococcoidia bacterium]